MAREGLKGNKVAGRPRHVPQRICSACRRAGPKESFIRVVLTPEGTIEIDKTGKKAGRGAYLCRQKSCWEKGLTERVLGHALRVKPASDSFAGLREHMKDFNDNSPAKGGK